MPEWSNGLDSKSSDGLAPSVGSNPTPSAIATKLDPKGSNFIATRDVCERTHPGSTTRQQPIWTEARSDDARRARAIGGPSQSHSLRHNEKAPPGVFSLYLGGDLLDLAPDAQQIAAPQFFDVVLAVAPAHQLQSNVERLAGVEPVDNAAAAIEV